MRVGRVPVAKRLQLICHAGETRSTAGLGSAFRIKDRQLHAARHVRARGQPFHGAAMEKAEQQAGNWLHLAAAQGLSLRNTSWMACRMSILARLITEIGRPPVSHGIGNLTCIAAGAAWGSGRGR